MTRPDSEQRMLEIRRRLQSALQPTLLEIFDDSQLHAGHVGASDGRGHFRIEITAAGLAGLDTLAQHRKIYAALGDLMATDIHAVSIKIKEPRHAS